MKYRVTFEFLNCLGNWVEDDLSNNGAGFTQEEAEQLAAGLNQRVMDENAFPTRNARPIPV